MRVFAPGKLIISGEHAVVYGNPALAMAVNRHAITTIHNSKLPQVLFDSTHLTSSNELSLTALHALKDKFKTKYQNFLLGKFSIKEVLAKPFDLAQFALSAVLDAKKFRLQHGLNISVHSTIPMGAGMGSSAATILSVMKAVIIKLKLQISDSDLFKIALEAETMQHGKTSGLDLKISLNGGCHYVEAQQLQERMAPQFPLLLVNTGRPLSSTGECVTTSAKHFTASNLLDDFASVTKMIDTALINNDLHAFCSGIQYNHRLLQTIGVVPSKVSSFIQKIEQLGAAAKICGAGTIAGDAAGVMLVVGGESAAMVDLCKQFHYEVMPIACEPNGVHSCEG